MFYNNSFELQVYVQEEDYVSLIYSENHSDLDYGIEQAKKYVLEGHPTEKLLGAEYIVIYLKDGDKIINDIELFSICF